VLCLQSTLQVIRIKNNDCDRDPIPERGDTGPGDSVTDRSSDGMGGYSPIPLTNLCADTAADFSLLLKNKDGKFLLYRNANTTLTQEHLETLLFNGVGFLYISKDDRVKYIRYVEQHLDTILSTEIPRSEKAALVYATANQLLDDVMRDPGCVSTIARVDALVDTTISQVITDKRNLIHLLEVMAFDYSTYTHSVNVGVLGLALAHHLGFACEELSQLGSGLLLHDVGKSQISRDILFKTGPLSEEEWQIVQQHPLIGQELLLPSGKVAKESMIVVTQHHEKCNGYGYPGRLREDEIHRFAKIAAIVDVFDALTTERVYKNAIETFPAIQIMMQEMNGSFCTDYLREFVQMLNLSANNRLNDDSDAEAA
jgi:HD-GYP domain-containing protein (c-di-GMP phosphodiesterase class II)